MVKKIQLAATSAAFATPRLTVVGAVLYGFYDISGSAEPIVQCTAIMMATVLTSVYIIYTKGTPQ